MQKKNMKEESNDWGSIGIGAMIVFIALILVAAVASAVIIQTGEKLQQNAQQSGSDTQQEISGKISIITVWVGDQGTAGAEEITMVFELAPGSEPIADTAVHWAVICDDGAGTPSVVDGDLSAATELDGATAVAQFDPGETYMIDLVVGGGAGATCAPALNEEHSMVISANGGGSTYETLYYQSTTQGDQVV
jgi:archaellum component FlaG (FlaF/FlaG flagellin family)|tara:strand:- start:434 stop:1009 length:576 start_codon:yes stop_codon:yes gene_type:complete